MRGAPGGEVGPVRLVGAQGGRGGGLACQVLGRRQGGLCRVCQRDGAVGRPRTGGDEVAVQHRRGFGCRFGHGTGDSAAAAGKASRIIRLGAITAFIAPRWPFDGALRYRVPLSARGPLPRRGAGRPPPPARRFRSRGTGSERGSRRRPAGSEATPPLWAYRNRQCRHAPGRRADPARSVRQGR